MAKKEQSIRSVAISAVLSFLAGALSSGESDAPTLTIHANTRLVQVSVVAQDHKGRPLLDLKREDFQLFDNKKRRQIQLFSIDRVEPVPASASKPSSTSGHVFSNTTDERSTVTGITVIVLDLINTKWTDQSQAARQILNFLRQIKPGDRIAIYSLNHGGFQVLHDFTRDASDLVDRLAEWKGEITAPERGQTATDLGTTLASVLQGQDAVHLQTAFWGDAELHDATGTLRALEMIARRLEGIPGRKNVIWISDGFPEVEWGNLAATAVPGPHDVRGPDLVPLTSDRLGMPRGVGGEIHDTIGDSTSNREPFVRAMRQISQANIAIYPVEARGLLGGSATQSERVYQQSVQAPMLEIAKMTGGRAFINDNDVTSAIRESLEDARVTYTLGFYPDSDHVDGKFHSVTIKMASRRDVTLRYRRGYVDELITAADLGRRKSDLDQAFWSPLDANAIPLTVKVSAVSPGRALLDLSIDESRLNLVPADGRHKGEVDILILQRNETGNVFGRINETVQMALKDSTYQKFLTSGVPYHRVIEVEPNATVIRVVVRDSAGGNLGSLTIPAAALKN